MNKGNCPVCGASETGIFLTRQQVPVHQNLIIRNQDDAIKIVRGDLNLTVCRVCSFIFNQGFQLSKLCYGENYDNNQACSLYFGDYMDNLVKYLVFEKQVQNCRVVEVGCGQGLFLKKVIEAGAGNIGYGFDPSYHGPAADLDGRLIFEKRYYGPECADIQADVVICRHVIEHVPEPVGLLNTIRQALVNSPCARIFLETPCVEWILYNHVIWDLFYEHCSYFSAYSLTTAVEAAGFKVESVRHVFGGQYLWLEATISDEKPLVTKNSDGIPQLAQQYAVSENDLKVYWQNKLRELVNRGKVAVWGAGAKGVTFVNLIDPERKWIDCVVDINANKQGHFLPGTGHPIISYLDLEKRGVVAAIIMNPNYYAENQGLLEAANIQIELIGVEK